MSVLRARFAGYGHVIHIDRNNNVRFVLLVDPNAVITAHKLEGERFENLIQLLVLLVT